MKKVIWAASEICLEVVALARYLLPPTGLSSTLRLGEPRLCSARSLSALEWSTWITGRNYVEALAHCPKLALRLEFKP